MKIVLSGASGMVGSALSHLLADRGYSIVSLVRSAPLFKHEVQWNPGLDSPVELSELESADCFIHLSGETINQRWSPAAKERLRSSRIVSTARLVQLMGKLSAPPKAFLCASATGIYGTHPAHPCAEDAPSGEGFLAAICRDWEAEALKAEALGVRVCRMRFGVVLSPEGGMLGKLMPIFKLGLGGPVGSGWRNLSWISLLDLCRAVEHLIKHDISGAVNFSSPAPETNYFFTRKFAKAIHRPAILPVPEFMLKLIFGQMAEETILSSVFAVPDVLLGSGFEFMHPVLDLYFQDIFRD